jgi:hypothetical protein
VTDERICAWCPMTVGMALHGRYSRRQLRVNRGEIYNSHDIVERLEIWNDAPPMGPDAWRQGYAAACRDVLRSIGQEVAEPTREQEQP